MKTLLSSIGLSLCFAVTAFAQPTLERLEDSIRRQNAAGAPAATPLTAAPGGEAREPGYLGAVLDDRTDRGRGVRIVDLRSGTPAEKAGFQKNDMITGIAGQRVREMRNLADILAMFRSGDAVTVDVLRGNQTVQIKVTLGRRPAAAGPVPPSPAEGVKPAETVPTPADPAARSPALPARTEPVVPAPPSMPGPALTTPTVPREPPLIEPVPSIRAAEGADKTLVAELQRRIEQLERRVAELEKALAEKR